MGVVNYGRPGDWLPDGLALPQEKQRTGMIILSLCEREIRETMLVASGCIAVTDTQDLSPGTIRVGKLSADHSRDTSFDFTRRDSQGMTDRKKDRLLVQSSQRLHTTPPQSQAAHRPLLIVL